METLLSDIETGMVLAAQALTVLVTLATIISAITPTRSDDSRLDRVLQLVNLLAGNVGHNRNADDA